MLPVSDPGSVIEAHLDEIRAAIDDVLRSGWFILGSQVSDFENEFAAVCGVDHGVGVGSGTDAVALALEGCGVGPGDAVFTVSHTAVATVAAIMSIGATPILVDIDPATMTMSTESLREAITTTRTTSPLIPRAVVVVHLYGRPADLPELLPLAAEAGLVVIEDAAQAHGATIDDRPVGSFGAAAAFSFYPTKNLGGIGDGGIVVTNDEEIANEVRRLRQYGWRARFVSESVGRNSRLDELQAAVLRRLLPHLASLNDHRVAIAQAYNRTIRQSSVTTPAPTPANVGHVYHQYVVQSGERDALAAHLASHDIGSAILYPLPVHLQPAYRDRLPAMTGLDNTEAICSRILSLPIGQHVDVAAVERIADIIGQFQTQP